MKDSSVHEVNTEFDEDVWDRKQQTYQGTVENERVNALNDTKPENTKQNKTKLKEVRYKYLPVIIAVLLLIALAYTLVISYQTRQEIKFLNKQIELIRLYGRRVPKNKEEPTKPKSDEHNKKYGYAGNNQDGAYEFSFFEPDK